MPEDKIKEKKWSHKRTKKIVIKRMRIKIEIKNKAEGSYNFFIRWWNGKEN